MAMAKELRERLQRNSRRMRRLKSFKMTISNPKARAAATRSEECTIPCTA